MDQQLKGSRRNEFPKTPGQSAMQGRSHWLAVSRPLCRRSFRDVSPWAVRLETYPCISVFLVAGCIPAPCLTSITLLWHTQTARKIQLMLPPTCQFSSTLTDWIKPFRDEWDAGRPSTLHQSRVTALTAQQNSVRPSLHCLEHSYGRQQWASLARLGMCRWSAGLPTDCSCRTVSLKRSRDSWALHCGDDLRQLFRKCSRK